MMPIRPENRARYPKNWRQIVASIRERSGNRCEGSPAYPDCREENGKPHSATGSVVVLTVAHLDHLPENCAEDNLRHWCQRCHNTYDAPIRARGVKARRRATAALGDLLLAALLVFGGHADAGTFFRAEESGTVRGTSGPDFIALGTGSGRGIGCGGSDHITGGNDDPGQPHEDRLYGDRGPNGECANSSGPDFLHLGPGDIGFGGLGRDTYILHGLHYGEFAQIDQFNLSRDTLLTVAGARMALVGATVVNRTRLENGAELGMLMALELRAPDYGNVEGSGHWVLVRLATGEQPMVVIPAGGTVLTAPDVERYRRKVLRI